MNEGKGINQLLADAKLAYSSGLVKPKQFHSRRVQGNKCCLLGAAFALHNPTDFYSTPSAIRNWLERHYNISTSELDHIESGFDSPDIEFNNKAAQMAAELGREMFGLVSGV